MIVYINSSRDDSISMPKAKAAAAAESGDEGSEEEGWSD